MRLTTLLLAALTMVALATPAAAQLTIATSSTSDLNAIGIGETFTIEISLTVPSPEAQGLTLRVDGINTSVLAFDSATLANVGVPGVTAPGGSIFGDLVELIPGFPPIYSSGIDSILSGPVDNGTNVVLFDGVSTGATIGTGPEVFTITFDALATGTVDLDIGAIQSFGDAYVSTSGTTFPFETVSVTVPEPGAVAASLAALGSVMGVVTVRRRRDD